MKCVRKKLHRGDIEAMFARDTIAWANGLKGGYPAASSKARNEFAWRVRGNMPSFFDVVARVGEVLHANTSR